MISTSYQIAIAGWITFAATKAGTTAITVTATASSAVSGGDQTVNLGVTGTNITAGDYTLTNNILTILNGATTGSVTFTVADDPLVESLETAILTISSPSLGITLGATTTQNIAITDNDSAVITITPTSTTATEGGVTGTYTVVLTSQPTDSTCFCDRIPRPNLNQPNATVRVINGSPNVRIGTNQNDAYYGNNSSSFFNALLGDDNLFADDQGDTLNGNEGNDFIVGGTGNDSLFGGKDDDIILGGEGEDRMRGNQDNDSLNGREGNDLIYGDAGNDFLQSGKENDTFQDFLLV